MIGIGICDDNEADRNRLHGLCEQIFCLDERKREYKFFSSGEEVINYCKNEGKLIDILFLDVEMDGISGLEVKDEIVEYENIQRIIFTSSYKDYVWESFGKRTLGFIIKPTNKEEVSKWLTVVLDEIQHDEYIEIKSGKNSHMIKLNNIAYFCADGNYTEIYLNVSNEECKSSLLVTKKLKELLEELNSIYFVRTHKSYAVNIMNIIEVGPSVSLKGMKQKVPIGRSYKDNLKKRYMEYVKERIRKRI